MLYPIFGLPGPLTDWCRQAVVDLLQARGRNPQVFAVNAVEDLAVHLMAGHDALVLMSRRPEHSLLSALSRAKVPVVVAAESPIRSAAFRTAHDGLDRITSVREVLADLAALQDMPRQQEVLVFTRRSVLEDPKAALAAMMRHFGGLDLGGDRAGSAGLKHFDALTRIIPIPEAGTLTEETKPGTAPVRDPVGDALLGLDDADGGDDFGTIVISPDFFFVTATGQPPSATPLDATGRPRLLVHGPFICLGRGDWIARCVHRFSEDLAAASFGIDVITFAGSTLHELARSSFKIPSSSGLVETTLQFRVEVPTSPLEVRFFAERAIFSGEITLGPVIFSRTDSARAEPYPPNLP